ncbi:MAG: hypothetical protein CYPHOPRED_001784 [Cyphobasidiales sp. Tagirdzhanova-0007]|nr:MAG: hypothetical protein CYPHOPRED_001784 [Cyphobasidiales sp. Tagirdzhanova-0007]
MNQVSVKPHGQLTPSVKQIDLILMSGNYPHRSVDEGPWSPYTNGKRPQHSDMSVRNLETSNSTPPPNFRPDSTGLMEELQALMHKATLKEQQPKIPMLRKHSPTTPTSTSTSKAPSIAGRGGSYSPTFGSLHNAGSQIIASQAAAEGEIIEPFSTTYAGKRRRATSSSSGSGSQGTSPGYHSEHYNKRIPSIKVTPPKR